MRVAAFCDFYSDAFRPLKLIVSVNQHELDWSQTLYVPIAAPFEQFEVEDFGDLLAVSVLMEDLVRTTDTNILGIHLPQMARRHGTEADLLILEMDDVEEVLGFEHGLFRTTNLSSNIS
ncbi:hypothetical protein D3C81_1455290 [compost metagenome]